VSFVKHNESTARSGPNGPHRPHYPNPHCKQRNLGVIFATNLRIKRTVERTMPRSGAAYTVRR